MARRRPQNPHKRPPKSAAARRTRIATIEDIERYALRRQARPAGPPAVNSFLRHQMLLAQLCARDEGVVSPAVRAIVGAALGAGAAAAGKGQGPEAHAPIPAPRGKKTGRAPAVTLAEFRAHVAAHPGVSDRARARMLSSELARPVSRYSVMRLRRRLEIETP